MYAGHKPRLVLASPAALVISAGLFGADTNNSEVVPALLYVPIPLLIWTAVRFGPQGLLTALTLVTVMAIVGVANGLGPFEERSAPANILNLQFFLFGVGVPLFLLATAVDDARAVPGPKRNSTRGTSSRRWSRTI
jgi:two-component system, LuxR family, sensor kinase FixL